MCNVRMLAAVVALTCCRGTATRRKPCATVILAGEKLSQQRDYFMQEKDFDRVVEPYRQGKKKGSNYLFLDGHAETQLPRAVKSGIDPWDVQRVR